MRMRFVSFSVLVPWNKSGSLGGPEAERGSATSNSLLPPYALNALFILWIED